MPKAPVTHLQDTGHSWLVTKAPESTYQLQEFPKRMHHKTKPSVVVTNANDQEALGTEWAESPAAFDEPEAPAEPAPVPPAPVTVTLPAAKK